MEPPIYRLSERIRELEQEGYKIEHRKVSGKSYAEYRLRAAAPISLRQPFHQKRGNAYSLPLSPFPKQREMSGLLSYMLYIVDRSGRQERALTSSETRPGTEMVAVVKCKFVKRVENFSKAARLAGKEFGQAFWSG